MNDSFKRYASEQYVNERIVKVTGDDGKLLNSFLPDGYPYEIVEQVLVGEANISGATANADVPGTYKTSISIINTRNITLGKSYIVDLDGEEYLVKYEEYEGRSPDSGIVLVTLDALGNPYYYNTKGWFEDRGLPFLIIPQYSSSNLTTNKKYSKITIYEANTEVVAMHEKYLPGSIPSVGSAVVGQTIKVSEVDESGKPVSWEAADLLTKSYVDEAVESKQITSKQAVNVVASEDIAANEVFYAANPVVVVDDVVNMATATYNTFSGANASSDNGVVVVCEDSMTSGSSSYNIRLYEAIDSQLTLKNTQSRVVDAGILSAAINSDGSLLVIGGSFTGKAKLYSISNYALNYISDIPCDANGNAFSGEVKVAKFSPDGSLLVLSNDDMNTNAKLYSVSGTSVTYVGDIGSTGVTCAAFNPDGSLLVLGYSLTTPAKLYSVSGTTVEYITDIGDATYVTEAGFSPKGDLLITVSDTTVPFNIEMYAVSGTDIAYVDDVLDADGSALGAVYNCDCMAFSHDGSLLVLGCDDRTNYKYCAKLYSVSGVTVEYIRDMSPAMSDDVFDNNINAVTFSGDDSIVVISSADGGYGCRGHVLGEKYTAYPVSKNFDREFYITCLSDNSIAQGDSASVYQIFEHQKSAVSEIIPMSMGGTGSTNGAAGLANLFSAGATVLTEGADYQYGDTLPPAGTKGRLFFKKIGG